MNESACSIFQSLSADIPVAFWRGEYIHLDRFQNHVYAIAESLPDSRHAVNLCEDRYLFLVSFTACLLRSQACLLPPNRADRDIERLTAQYPDAYCIVDSGTDTDYPGQFTVHLDDFESHAPPGYEIDSNAVAAIVFTSGSTGAPQAHEKRWADLVASSLKLEQSLGLEGEGFNTIVATVPPQHMYGFELSIIYPLVNGACMHAGRAFFPQDIDKDLREVASPRVLVTTPIHLRACNEADIEWPEIRSIVSAASELPAEVARLAETLMDTGVVEVYGCTEAGAIATRPTTRGDEWHLLEGYSVESRPDSAILRIPGIEESILLPDRIDVIDDRKFYLVGRNSDLVKVGGKRASLANLANILKSIHGVKDGLIFDPDPDGAKRTRLAALVVAPALNEDQILTELAKQIDRVFLPRRIVKVDSLPYNDSGKLTRDSISDLFKCALDGGDRNTAANIGYGG